MLYTWFFVGNAVLGIPYGRSEIFCIEFICNLSNPQALCASSFAKGAYAVSHCFTDSLLFKLNFRLGLLRKLPPAFASQNPPPSRGRQIAARRAED